MRAGVGVRRAKNSEYGEDPPVPAAPLARAVLPLRGSGRARARGAVVRAVHGVPAWAAGGTMKMKRDTRIECWLWSQNGFWLFMGMSVADIRWVWAGSSCGLWVSWLFLRGEE